MSTISSLKNSIDKVSWMHESSHNNVYIQVTASVSSALLSCHRQQGARSSSGSHCKEDTASANPAHKNLGRKAFARAFCGHCFPPHRPFTTKDEKHNHYKYTEREKEKEKERDTHPQVTSASPHTNAQEQLCSKMHTCAHASKHARTDIHSLQVKQWKETNIPCL